jgi:hypothetical protein
MSALVAGTLTPLVREVPLPAQGLPELAELLHTRGCSLVDLAIRLLYEPNRPGWFAVPTHRELLHRWAAAVGQDVLSADWSSALATTHDLIVESHRGGSSLVERVQYLERFGDASVRALEQEGTDGCVVLDARRLFRNVRRVALVEPESAGGARRPYERSPQSFPPNLSPGFQSQAETSHSRSPGT